MSLILGDDHDNNQEDIFTPIESLDLNLQQAYALWVAIDIAKRDLEKSLNFYNSDKAIDKKVLEINGVDIQEKINYLTGISLHLKDVTVNLKEVIQMLDTNELIFKPKKDA